MDNVRWDLKTMVDWIDWDEFEASARELKPSSIQDRRDMRDPTAIGTAIINRNPALRATDYADFLLP